MTEMNYKLFRMDEFRTAERWCFSCDKVEKCSVCPVMAAFSGSSIGTVPDYVCKINKIKIKEKEKFFEELKFINQN